MPIADTNIIQGTFKGKILGQTWMNVYHFVVQNLTGSLDITDVASDIANRFTLHYNEVMSPDVTLDTLEVRNRSVYPNDFIDYPIGIIGSRSVNVFAPFTTVTAKYPTSGGSVQAGGKRFPGVAEEDVEDGLITNTLTYNNYDILAAQFLVPIIVSIGPNGCDLVPVITRPASPSHENTTFFTEPTTTVNVSSFVSTQNTRKFGRGE